jgi:hypothetical protein
VALDRLLRGVRRLDLRSTAPPIDEAIQVEVHHTDGWSRLDGALHDRVVDEWRSALARWPRECRR